MQMMNEFVDSTDRKTFENLKLGIFNVVFSCFVPEWQHIASLVKFLIAADNIYFY